MNRSTVLFLSNQHRLRLQSLTSSGSCTSPFAPRSWASETPAQPKSDASIVTEGSSGSTQTSAMPKSASESSWTEVVHPESGKTYFWNQQSGETTELGAPKPADDQRSDSGSQGGSSGHQGTETANDRSESPLPDRTGYYAATGALVGAVLGWASHFF